MRMQTKILVLLVCFLGIVIVSCQKAIPDEAEVTATADFLPSDTACPITLSNNSLVEGQALTGQENIRVELRVLKPGFWSVSSDTKNGVFFSGSGIFQDTGRTFITLNARGVPLKPGNFYYSLTNGTYRVFIAVKVLKDNIVIDTVPLESYFKATIGGVNYYSKAAIVGPDNVSYGHGGVENVSLSSFVGQNNAPFPAGTGAVSLQKNFLQNYSTATETDFKNFFKPGSYPFSTKCGGNNLSSGIILFWTDANRQGWWTLKELADQTGSFFTIVGIEDGHDSKGIYFVKVRSRFACKLYHPRTGEMVELTNGELVSFFKK